MNLRTQIIQKGIHINEAIFFYPKLKRFYKKKLDGIAINILDVGANKGQSIDFFIAINLNVHIDAFEPNKKLFNFLLNKYKSNTNIKLNNVGVSNVNGELEFNENILDETSTFEVLNLNSKYLEKKAKVLGVKKENIIIDKYKVNVICLRDFFRQNPNTFYDLLKIDVEGHELQVLEGLFCDNKQKYPIRLIQIESHNDDMYLNHGKQKDIEKRLNENGFFQIAKIKHGFGDFAEIIYENKKIS